MSSQDDICFANEEGQKPFLTGLLGSNVQLFCLCSAGVPKFSEKNVSRKNY